jgi:hypothetical protein
MPGAGYNQMGAAYVVSSHMEDTDEEAIAVGFEKQSRRHMYFGRLVLLCV